MTRNIQQQLEKLEVEKERLKRRENLLREREKRKRAKRFEEIGKLAYRANIDQLDTAVLLGAFREIAERAKRDDELKAWEKAGGSPTTETSQAPAIAVSFQEDPNAEIHALMRQRNFRWNRFRREYYGKAQPAAIQTLLGSRDFKIEVLK